MSFDRTRPDGRRKYASVTEAQAARRQQNRERMRLKYWAHRTEAAHDHHRRKTHQAPAPVRQAHLSIPPPPRGALALSMASLPLR